MGHDGRIMIMFPPRRSWGYVVRSIRPRWEKHGKIVRNLLFPFTHLQNLTAFKVTKLDESEMYNSEQLIFQKMATEISVFVNFS